MTIQITLSDDAVRDISALGDRKMSLTAPRDEDPLVRRFRQHTVAVMVQVEDAVFAAQTKHVKG